MFGRKKENQVLSDNDAQQLLVSIDNIIAGDFSDVSVSSLMIPLSVISLMLCCFL